MNLLAHRIACLSLPSLIAASAFALMSACSQQNPAPPAAPSASAQAAANEATADQDLKL
jgi:hypothetical protein